MKTTSRRGILLAAGWVIIFFLLAPSLIVFPISLTDTSYLGLPEHGLSLQHWHTVVTNRVWRGGFMQSLVIALSASAVQQPPVRSALSDAGGFRRASANSCVYSCSRH